VEGKGATVVADPVDPVTGLVVADVGTVVAAVPPRVDVERDVVVVVGLVVVVVVPAVVDVVVERSVVEVARGGVTVVCNWTGTRGTGVGRTIM
jgi:hypothetical protein